MIPADHLRPPDEFARALAAITPAMLCTLCVAELKLARAAGQPDPEVHPGIVLGSIVTGGVASPGMLCEIRHQLDVAVGRPAPLVIASAGAVSDPGAMVRTLGLTGPGMA